MGVGGEHGPSPPMGALGRRLADAQRRPQIIGLGLGVAVGLGIPLFVLPALVERSDRANPLPTLWLSAAVAIGSLVLCTLIVAFLPPFLARGQDRTASVVHAWIGAREVRRLLGSASAAIGIPSTAEDAAQWLDARPETPELLPLRFELLVMARRFDEARAVAERLPRRTSLDEYRYLEALALVDDQQTGSADVASLRSAVTRLPAGVDRAEARASLAVFEARRASDGASWREPLVAARPEIPERDSRILARDLGLPIFLIFTRRIAIPIAALIVFLAAAMSVLMLF